ncbi:MAG: hypothetical protein ABH822_00800 [Patescibacteria group bacterium]
MAIVIKERNRGVNWFVFLVFIILFAIVIGGGYYLFFAPTPGIEVVSPSVLQSTSEIAEVQFDPSVVISHPQLKNLRQIGGLPTVGDLGRENPLLAY